MNATATTSDMVIDNSRLAAGQLTVSEKGTVQCVACAHRCRIPDGRSGICKVRRNVNGRLRVPWGYVAAIQSEPIEKKPFFHVCPGTDALTFGMLGCSLHCAYCQNWVTSQALRDPRAGSQVRAYRPEEFVEMAREVGARTLVSSYNEPLISSEWAADVFSSARSSGLYCGFVSNGYATDEALDFLAPFLSFYKVDLKTFSARNYRQLGGELKCVLRTIEGLHERGIWLEVVTLIVRGFNDDDGQLRGVARFLASISPSIVWHVTPFQPDYRMTKADGFSSRTSAETLFRAWEFGLEAGLRFVYAGNRPGQVRGGENTSCPGCGCVVIERLGYRVVKNSLQIGRCPECTEPIPGIWD